MSKTVRLNLCGRLFDRLSVLRFLPLPGCRKSHWSCRCRCGKVVAVRQTDLLTGRTRSCGCLQDESRRKVRR